MQRYRQNPWVFAVIGVMAIFGLLFGAGVWYMVAIGFSEALGFWGSQILAWVAAPGVALGSVVMFVWGEHIKKYVLDWEFQNGKIEKQNAQGELIGYEEGWRSAAHWVGVIKVGILLLDSAGIVYRVLTLDTTLIGKILLIIVFEVLAILPWPLGILVYRVIHRPAGAIRRDIDEAIEIAEAHHDLEQARKTFKKPGKLAPHMRPPVLASPTRPLPNFTPALVTEVSSPDHQSQNGQSPTT